MRGRRVRHPGALLFLVAVAAGTLAAWRLLRGRYCGAPERALSRRLPGQTTRSIVSVTPAGAPLGEPGHNDDLRLDEALKETFPASDPISIHIEQESGSAEVCARGAPPEVP